MYDMVLCMSDLPFPDLFIYFIFLFSFLINDNFIHLHVSWCLGDFLDKGS